MRRALLALLLVLANVALAGDPGALAALETCAGKLDPALDLGYERITARCPDLAGALEHSEWAAWLPPDWKEPDNQLSAAGLRALHDVLLRESAGSPGTGRLHPERVHEVLKRFTGPERQQEGWWGRFKRWLRELLTPQPRNDSSWWRRLLGDASIDQDALRLVAGLVIALLVVIALAVVLNELRVAGLLRRSAGSLVRPGIGAATRGGLSLSDVEAAEPGAQPALLLELITARLAAQDRLPPARAFTVRELTERVRLPDGAGRGQLADLAGVSEQVRYAGVEVPAPVLSAALRAGRELLAALEAPATEGAG